MNEKAVVVPGKLRVHLCPKVASRSMFEAFKQEKRAYVTDVNAGGPEYRFHCVRHPLDRLVSLWAYFCKGDGLNGQPQVAKLGYFKGQTFDDFLDVVCERHDENIHTRMQVAFAGPYADRRCRYEHLADEWTALCQRVRGVRIRRELPVIHKTSHTGWTDYYTSETRLKAETTFAPDMALYEGADTYGRTT